MDPVASSKTWRPAIGWIVALTILFECAALVTGWFPHAPANETLQTLVLLTIALTGYAWGLLPPAGSLALSVAVFGSLCWVWGARQHPVAGVGLAAGFIVVAVAAWQRHRRVRRCLRMQQVLDDLAEEQTIKDQAIALASQTRETLSKKLSRYTQLQTIAEELSNLTDLASIAELAVTRAFSLIGKSDVCLLFLVNQEQQELSLFASKKREAIATIRAKHGDQFDRYVLRTHRPLLVNDVRRDFRFTIGIAPEREVGSVIACPLMVGQTPEGVLRLDSARPAAYTQDDLRFLDILLDLLSVAMTNAKLFARTQQLAITDGLTGLTLRRPFLEQLSREMIRAGRGREPLSVLMADVDHFKQFNDAFGHTAGDVILKGVAEVLRVVVPPGALVARYGGEEFVVLLPRLTRHEASDVAEKLRRVVEAQVQSGGRVPMGASAPVRLGGVTLSVGVASFPDDAQGELELIRVADQRLYQAKRAGRNLVCSS